MLNNCCMSHHPLEKMSWCEADLAGTWYRLWKIKCCWQNPLCSGAIPHNTKLEAPLRKRSLLRLRSDYLNYRYSQWKRCTACSTVDMIFLFSLPMCIDESGHIAVPEINQCFACFEQREQNIFISSILNPPSVLLVSGSVLSLVASLSLYIRAVYQQEAQGKVL